jgi:DNA invertase Pin-like site-specific DNA recombinase
MPREDCFRITPLKKGFQVAEVFTDVETAKRAGRTSFGKMVAFLRQHRECRTILVEKTDRLYRNLTDYVILDEFPDLEIHFVKENFVLRQDSRSSEKFVHGIKVLMAKNYVDNLREETQKGMMEKARQGIWPSFAPIGYLNVVRSDGKKAIEVDPVRGPLWQRFDHYDKGTSQAEACVCTPRTSGHGIESAFALVSLPSPFVSYHQHLPKRIIQ